jgi:hypothetical protein
VVDTLLAPCSSAVTCRSQHRVSLPQRCREPRQSHWVSLLTSAPILCHPVHRPSPSPSMSICVLVYTHTHEFPLLAWTTQTIRVLLPASSSWMARRPISSFGNTRWTVHMKSFHCGVKDPRQPQPHISVSKSVIATLSHGGGGFPVSLPYPLPSPPFV